MVLSKISFSNPTDPREEERGRPDEQRGAGEPRYPKFRRRMMAVTRTPMMANPEIEYPVCKSDRAFMYIDHSLSHLAFSRVGGEIGNNQGGIEDLIQRKPMAVEDDFSRLSQLREVGFGEVACHDVHHDTRTLLWPDPPHMSQRSRPNQPRPLQVRQKSSGSGI